MIIQKFSKKKVFKQQFNSIQKITLLPKKARKRERHRAHNLLNFLRPYIQYDVYVLSARPSLERRRLFSYLKMILSLSHPNQTLFVCLCRSRAFNAEVVPYSLCQPGPGGTTASGRCLMVRKTKNKRARDLCRLCPRIVLHFLMHVGTTTQRGNLTSF